MVQINWTEQAVFDLKDIKSYISKNSNLYAGIVIRNLKVRTSLLKSFPKSGRIIPEIDHEDFSELIEGSYRIMYKIVDENRIDILSVFHSSKTLLM